MSVTTFRVCADCVNEASAKAWGRHPRALAIIIKYLYKGWWEYAVLLEEVA